MKAYPGRDIELEVGVVHAVQTPEGRHRMEKNVLKVDGRRSSRIIPSGIAAQGGTATALNNPQPRTSASRASATAVIGNTKRTTNASRTTRPILLGQRTPRAMFWSRRGASSSHTTIPAKILAKAARRMNGSFDKRASIFNKSLE